MPIIPQTHPLKQPPPDRAGASIGSDHQKPSRTARKQRPPPSFPARAGPFPQSTSPTTHLRAHPQRPFLTTAHPKAAAGPGRSKHWKRSPKTPRAQRESNALHRASLRAQDRSRGPSPRHMPKKFTFPASPEFPNVDHIKPMTFPLLSRIHRGAHRGSIRACKIVVLLSLLTAGCDPSGSTKTLAPQSPTTQAAADPSTALILAAVDNGFHRVPIALTTDYGFLVVNAGDDEHPIPSVSVGFRSERRIIQCGSLAEFEAALRTVPPGSTIHRHERCLTPASRGLAEEFLAGIEPTLSRVGITVAPEPVITCLCGR